MKLLKPIVIILITLFSFFTTTAQEKIAQEHRIDAIFSRWNAEDAPGGTVGIIKDGNLIFAKGYGMANLDHRVPNTSATTFRIASTSKQFTAACIILLTQEGKLSLSDKLSAFFPNFPDYANEISIQHLLNHTSGIRDYLILSRLAGLSRLDYYTDEMIEKWLTNQQALNNKPGDAYVYSNSGYWLLGQIVEKISGKTLAQYATEKIFTPLTMTHTHFHDNHEQIVKNKATAYRPNGNGGYLEYMTTLNVVGPGGIYTTVDDLLKWDHSFYSSAVFNQDFWTQMTTLGRLNNGDELVYASGLGIKKYKGLKMIHHSGSYVGYKSEMIRFPEAQFTVIVLANRMDVDPAKMAKKVADLFLDNNYKAANKKEHSASKTSSKPISLTTKELGAFKGYYWSSINKSAVKLEVQNNTLTYVKNNRRATKLLPVAKHKLQLIGPSEPIILEMHPKGETKSFSVKRQGRQPVTFEEYTPLTSQDTNQLKTYLGDYYSKELDVTYTLKMMKNRFVLYVKDNPVGQLKPIMKDVFSINYQYIFEFDTLSNTFKLSMFDRVKNVTFVKSQSRNSIAKN